MICKVISTVERYALLENIKSVAVGVSGGADSVCLLHVLSRLKDEYGIIIKAAHINHNLRGDEAQRDEYFVRTLCEKWNIELRVFSVDVKSEAEKLGIGEEECGRLVRYRCFNELGCDAVAVAHSLSDSIETTLFNLARGTAIKGLCGIPAKRAPNIIRPLIECTRKEIEAYCIENNLRYVTDSTNLTCEYTRNHIRHNLIPDIAYINGGYEKSISRCMNSLSEDAEFIDNEAEKLYRKSVCGSGYSADVILEGHIALRKRIYHRLLSEHMNKDVDSKHISLFESVVSGKLTSVEIGKDLYVMLRNGIIYISDVEKNTDQWQADFVEGRADTPQGVYVISSCNKPHRDAFDASTIKGELYLSSREAGDTFTFADRKITKSLKKIFNEKKIPLSERNRIAVLHDANGVVWVEGVGVNAPYMAKDGTVEFFIIKKEG